MALWFAGSICSLLAHCVGTGSTPVLPLGYGFLALMGGSGGEEEGESKKGMVRQKASDGGEGRDGRKGEEQKEK